MCGQCLAALPQASQHRSDNLQHSWRADNWLASVAIHTQANKEATGNLRKQGKDAARPPCYSSPLLRASRRAIHPSAAGRPPWPGLPAALHTLRPTGTLRLCRLRHPLGRGGQGGAAGAPTRGPCLPHGTAATARLVHQAQVLQALQNRRVNKVAGMCAGGCTARGGDAAPATSTANHAGPPDM